MNGSGSAAPSPAVPRDVRAARDALGGLLARRLSEEGTGGGETVTVAELRRVLLPYPLCRESVPLASKAEYDMALLSLIHGGGGHLEPVDPELAEAVREELATAEPALGCLDDFAAASLRPASGPRTGGTPSAADAPAGAMAVATADTPAVEAPAEEAAASSEAASQEEQEAQPGAAQSPCPSCRRPLPEAVEVRFCPFCGTAQGERACRGCGRELEPEWRFCPRCGSEGRGPA